ncbi:hypothetical protein V5799_014847 [Amblyomma americanum]|uniref:Uncharacterized protein n=1 Tax=Amblyomma americanum TaxID=6943 RepID=A0AAQ4E1U5_AMBAM
MAAAHKKKCAGTAEDPEAVQVEPELHIGDAEVGGVNESATGLCAVSEGDVWQASAGVNCGQHSHGGRHRDTRGSANSYTGPMPESGRSNSVEDDCKCSPYSTLLSLYDGHHHDTETGRPEAGEDARSQISRADKAVQCDVFSSDWADHIEGLKRQISFYMKLINEQRLLCVSVYTERQRK